MNCVPTDIESVLYTWSVFAGIAMFSLFAAEVVALKLATDVGRSALSRIPLPRMRAFNVTLVAYMMVIFYITILLASLTLHAFLMFGHLTVQAMFTDKFGIGSSLGYVKKMLLVVNNYTDPQLVFGFLAPRLWKLHLGVLVAVLLAAVAHTLLFVSPARIRALGGWEDPVGEAGETAGRQAGAPASGGTAYSDRAPLQAYKTIFPVAWYGRRVGSAAPQDPGGPPPMPPGQTRRLPDPYLVQRLFSDTSSTVVTVLCLLYLMIVVREVFMVIERNSSAK